MKIAIVTDSNSGITQKQAQELGVFVLAMPFQIDGETYYEDITLTQEEFYKKLREAGIFLDISAITRQCNRSVG